ncbi:unnamed protein product [Pleuronectes platessa]|uniref:Uncharacterized protein n=1 Tax=Pleuronectes platessa TaxID=8262 RepID=A0A9N7YEB9_PLEPL|nr:unnamed protein product [Pleuronectes platessa]
MDLLTAWAATDPAVARLLWVLALVLATLLVWLLFFCCYGWNQSSSSSLEKYLAVTTKRSKSKAPTQRSSFTCIDLHVADRYECCRSAEEHCALIVRDKLEGLPEMSGALCPVGTDTPTRSSSFCGGTKRHRKKKPKVKPAASVPLEEKVEEEVEVKEVEVEVVKEVSVVVGHEPPRPAVRKRKRRPLKAGMETVTEERPEQKLLSDEIEPSGQCEQSWHGRWSSGPKARILYEHKRGPSVGLSPDSSTEGSAHILQPGSVQSRSDRISTSGTPQHAGAAAAGEEEEEEEDEEEEDGVSLKFDLNLEDQRAVQETDICFSSNQNCTGSRILPSLQVMCRGEGIEPVTVQVCPDRSGVKKECISLDEEEEEEEEEESQGLFI